MNEYKNYKALSAEAFLRAEDNSDAFAEYDSLFLIRATGNSSSVINQADFTPKIF